MFIYHPVRACMIHILTFTSVCLMWCNQQVLSQISASVPAWPVQPYTSCVVYVTLHISVCSVLNNTLHITNYISKCLQQRRVELKLLNKYPLNVVHLRLYQYENRSVGTSCITFSLSLLVKELRLALPLIDLQKQKWCTCLNAVWNKQGIIAICIYVCVWEWECVCFRETMKKRELSFGLINIHWCYLWYEGIFENTAVLGFCDITNCTL